ncbi:MAG: glutamate racemase [Candidatus Amulumruptor sp.]|nr:glutamate racemase [Candidatus Amulumruptor sp.]
MTHSQPLAGPIGIFDSGYGGLTILSAIRERLPGYDYLYLGDNARAPYGTRSFDIVYQFTLEAVRALFDRGCRLVILACNTASAKALRSIQQRDLPGIDPERRVLGVIRPTVEALGTLSRGGNIGIFATQGTVSSHSYDLEIAKLYPGFKVTSMPCPMWVPLIENGEAGDPGADYFVDKYTRQLLHDAGCELDTVILGCTHYPLLYPKIRAAVPDGISVVSQGRIVADSLADYLRRHPEMDNRCSKGGSVTYLTTENPEKFGHSAGLFLNHPIKAQKIII